MGSPLQDESLNNYDDILHVKIRFPDNLKAFEEINMSTALG